MKSFASDNYSGVCVEVMQAIQAVNVDHVAAYGNDVYTERAVHLLKQTFGENSVPFFVSNGTSANILGLKAITRSYQSIVCTDSAHIQSHEVGAAMNAIGCALVPVANVQGKMTAAALEDAYQKSIFWGRHSNKPAVVSITQSTEYGTVYTLQEIVEISAICKKHNLLLHMDGCRLSNAAAHLQVSLKALTTDLGVDVLSFGGTKNGLLFGEVIIFLQPHLAKDFEYIQKQGLQLTSKMRFLSAQFIPYLEDNIWLRNAKQANDACSFLADQLSQQAGVSFAYPVETNHIFAYLPKEAIEKMQKKFPFYIYNPLSNLVRLVTSFDTTEQEIEEFIRLGFKH